MEGKNRLFKLSFVKVTLLITATAKLWNPMTVTGVLIPITSKNAWWKCFCEFQLTWLLAIHACGYTCISLASTLYNYLQMQLKDNTAFRPHTPTSLSCPSTLIPHHWDAHGVFVDWPIDFPALASIPPCCHWPGTENVSKTTEHASTS